MLHYVPRFRGNDTKGRNSKVSIKSPFEGGFRGMLFQWLTPPCTLISAKLFCKHSQVTFMPYGAVLKDEPNIKSAKAHWRKRRTSNNDVAPLFKLF